MRRQCPTSRRVRNSSIAFGNAVPDERSHRQLDQHRWRLVCCAYEFHWQQPARLRRWRSLRARRRASSTTVYCDGWRTAFDDHRLDDGNRDNDAGAACRRVSDHDIARANREEAGLRSERSRFFKLRDGERQRSSAGQNGRDGHHRGWRRYARWNVDVRRRTSAGQGVIHKLENQRHRRYSDAVVHRKLQD